MRIGTASLISLVLLSACSTAPETPSSTTSSASTATASTTTSTDAPPTAPAPVTKKWVELAVGDCLADPPPTDPSVVTVTIVDCATPHRAEVFTRAPLAVNTALADVANRECAEGFSGYTGTSIDGSPFTVTFLIDSNQDRTSNNPDPSAVICVLQATDGQSLTGSARR